MELSPRRRPCLPAPVPTAGGAGRESTEKRIFVWRTESSGSFSKEMPPNKKDTVVLKPDPLYLPWPLRRLDLNPKGKKLLIQSSFPDWIRIESSLCDLCASAVKRITTTKDELERKTILELLQSTSSCETGFNLHLELSKILWIHV